MNRLFIIIYIVFAFTQVYAQPVFNAQNGYLSTSENDPTITLNATTFIANYDSNDADNDGWFGRCSVVTRADGVVVLAYREGARHDNERYGIVHFRFSRDGGISWTDQDRYFDGTVITPLRPTGAGNPSGNDRGPSHGILTLCPNGDILCHMWSSDYAEDHDGAHQSRSTDGGLTWSTSGRINFYNYPFDQGKTFFGEGRVVVDGVIYAVIRQYAIGGSSGNQNTFIATSSDNGVTWVVRGKATTILSPAPGGSSEMSLEYLGNGRFIGLLREANNSDGHYIYSEDWCHTWSAPVDITDALGLPSSSWLGRTQIYTRAHLQGKSNWWTDRTLIITGFIGTVAGQSTDDRVNFATVAKIPQDGNLANIEFFPVTYLDDPGYDGGYGDVFYNAYLGQYVFMSYRSPTSLFDGSVKQYNFSLTFE